MKTTIPVFSPTMQEFSDFEKYVENIENLSKGFGMVKVIPPQNWCARKKGYNLINPAISHPIKQVVTGLAGKYQVVLLSQKSMSYKSFKQYAIKREIKESIPIEDIERMVNYT